MTDLQEKHRPGSSTRQRPRVHFTAKDGWINDPYGITWDGTQYHLFYQAIPGRVTWAPHCQWGHAVSADLVHWQEQPTALLPQDYEVGCWSGSFVYDHEHRPTILYTSVAGQDWGQGQVALAHGDDTATHWTTAPSDTVITGPPPELGAHAFRDPFVWHTADGWTMLMAAGLPDGAGAALQYRSTDLRTWSYDGVLCTKGASSEGVWTGALWECPQLFPLGDEWVLLVSIWNADILHYVAAAVGDYDGLRFTPRTWQRLTYGQSAYAMTAFADKDGRRCVMSWLREEPQNDPTLTGWAGALSIVSLISLEQGRLVLRPHPDIVALQRPLAAAVFDCRVAASADAPVLITLDQAHVSAVEIADELGTRLRVDLSLATGFMRIQRVGKEPEDIPLDADWGGGVQLLIDADIAEVFGPTGYSAYRIRPAHGDAAEFQLIGLTPSASAVHRLEL